MIILDGGAGTEGYSCSESLCFSPGRAGSLKFQEEVMLKKYMLIRVRNNGLFIAQNFQWVTPRERCKLETNRETLKIGAGGGHSALRACFTIHYDHN